MVSEALQLALGGVMKMCVLILVLVEDGLRGENLLAEIEKLNCLNPCSCGGWTQSY